MKRKVTIITSTLISVLFSLITAKASAQTALDYYVLPMNTQVPIGEKMTFRLQYHDKDFHPQNGVNTYTTGGPPAWAILGTNGDAGSVKSDLNGFSAVYTAPGKVPKNNPVILTVKFKANDTSKEEVTILCHLHVIDPGQNWFFNYTCTQSFEEIRKSPHEEHTKRRYGSGAGSIIIDAPPEQDGYVIINTGEGDQVISSTANGTYNFYEKDLTTEPNNEIDEKTIRKYSGVAEKGQGLEFEYNSKDKGDQGGIQGAGISFDVMGTDEFWNHDANGKLRKFTNQVNEKSWARILLGHKEDKVSKIKNGFSINYSQSKDTTYTDAHGDEHTLKSMEQYHAELIRVNKK